MKPDRALIRLVLVDDHALVREQLRRHLELRGADSGIEIVGDADGVVTAFEVIEELSPDVVLMDLGMKGIDGVRGTRLIAEHFPGVRIVALTSGTDLDRLARALRAGAVGYVLKGVGDVPEQLRAILEEGAPKGDGTG